MPALNRGFASLTAQSPRHVGNRLTLCDMLPASYRGFRPLRKGLFLSWMLATCACGMDQDRKIEGDADVFAKLPVWRVDSVAMYTIGADTSNAREQLEQVTAAWILHDGTVVIAQVGDYSVRMFGQGAKIA